MHRIRPYVVPTVWLFLLALSAWVVLPDVRRPLAQWTAIDLWALAFIVLIAGIAIWELREARER